MARKRSKPKPPPRFRLEMSELQAQILVNALDLYSRIGIGQIEEVENVVRLEPHINKDFDPTAVKSALDFVKRELMGMDANQSFGIHHPSVPDHYKVAWDMQQVVRYVLAWTANPEGGSGVNFREPHEASRESLAKMEVVEEDPRSIDAPWQGS